MATETDKQVPQTKSSNATSIEKALEEQKEILLKIYEQSNKTRRYILFGRIIGVIYLILIIAPLIIALIYLPPLVQNMINPLQELLGQTQELNNNGLSADTISDILKQFTR